jgi:hypothetical protein
MAEQADLSLSPRFDLSAFLSGVFERVASRCCSIRCRRRCLCDRKTNKSRLLLPDGQSSSDCKRLTLVKRNVIFLIRNVLGSVVILSHPSLLPPIHHMHLRQSLAVFLRRRPAQVLLDLIRSHETESRVRYEAAANEQTRARREVAVGLPERHGLELV